MRYIRGSTIASAALAWAMSIAPGALYADDTAPSHVDYNAPDPDRDVLSYARGFANLLVADYVIYQIDWFRGREWAFVTRNSIATNLTSSFQFDYDNLAEDLLAHPLHGSLYFSAGRAAKLSFLESAIFPFLGSLSWEYFGERQVIFPAGWQSKPSLNDLVATSTSGVFLGEALYRISSELLDDSSTGAERVFRELAASVVSPMRAFNRLYTGDLWKRGAPPDRSHPLDAALDVGASRVVLLNRKKTYTISPLLALEILYGDLLPRANRRTLDPFEYFQGYVAFNLLQETVSGTQAYGNAILYGWSFDTTADTGELRDNNVFGLIGTFDFQGADTTHFGAMSVGVGDYSEWRWGRRRSLRFWSDIDWTYLLGADSALAKPDIGHNFSMGPAIGLGGRLQLGRAGEVDLRSRYYLGAVIDGQGRQEIVGYARLSYDVDLLPHVGIGLAPTLIHHQSSAGTRTVFDTSLEGQLYLRVHD